MADKDALAGFDFNQVSGSGLFLKFEAGRPVTIRVLTTDPVIQQQEFTDKLTGETNLSMKFNFIVYNFTDKKAQIWGASPAMSRKIGELHNDPDFGANIKNMDLKITPTGEGKERRYDMQVLRHSGNQTQLTPDQIKEAQAINLDEKIKDGSRMSVWKPETQRINEQPPLEDHIPEDVKIEDIGSEPINLDDIPF